MTSMHKTKKSCYNDREALMFELVSKECQRLRRRRDAALIFSMSVRGHVDDMSDEYEKVNRRLALAEKVYTQIIRRDISC
jgi:hypothetical protein